MKGYSIGFLVGVAVVRVIIIFRDEKVAGSVLSGVSFEGSIDGNLEDVGPVEGDTMGVSSVALVGTIQGPDG